MKQRHCKIIRGMVHDTLCVGRYLKQLDCCGNCETARKLSETIKPSTNFKYKCVDGCGTAVPSSGACCRGCKSKRSKSGQAVAYARTQARNKVIKKDVAKAKNAPKTRTLNYAVI